MRLASIAKYLVIACVLACGMALAGCAAGPSQNMTEEQQANRAYMSQVNEAMVELDANLDSFVDAVSRGDVVNMRTQADNAYKALDKLESLEAPETLADVRKSYVDGTSKLRKALDEYVSLYTAADKAGDSFDWSTYDKQISEIQKLYDEGVAALEQGDKTAAEA